MTDQESRIDKTRPTPGVKTQSSLWITRLKRVMTGGGASGRLGIGRVMRGFHHPASNGPANPASPLSSFLTRIKVRDRDDGSGGQSAP
jgi:hypothetical protein